MESVYNRVIETIAQGKYSYEQRVEAGTQPDLPFVNAKSLLIGNALYFGITFVLYLIMSRKKTPFGLKPLIAVYNAICVFLAGYVVYGIIRYKLKHPGNFACNPVDLSEDGKYLAWIIWVFLAQKFWEFADTWFFILRKSFRQVTFLHLFHHSSITFVIGSIVVYDHNGNMYLPVALNAFVHVLMYSHYLVTVLGMKSWWRHYLTSLQLIQFMIITTQSIVAYIQGPSCGLDFEKALLTVYMGSMLILFGNFFVRQYIVKEPPTGTSNGHEVKKTK